MKKIEAINQLLEGEVDGIKHGTSTFVLEKESIVNKRSKKLLDMKHMLEEEWDVIIEPKWYDGIGDSRGILCWIQDVDVSIVKKMDENGDFFNEFGDNVGNKESVRPVHVDEIEGFLIEGVSHPKRAKKKAKQEVREENVEPEVDDGVEIIEGNVGDSQNESLENTVPQKEDVGDTKNTFGDEDAEDNQEENTEIPTEVDPSTDEIPF